nr:HAD-IA family hydrolase [Anaerolineae bacterium]
MPLLRAVLFDMDDTLLDWSEHTTDWKELHRKQLKPVYSYLEQANYNLPTLDTLANTYNEISYGAWMSASPPQWYAPRQIDIMRATFQSLALDINEKLLRELEYLIDWGPLPGVKIFPDSVEVLQEIRKAGVRTGLLTNASSPMWMRDRELKAMGLLELLDERLTAGDVGYLKPHPQPFLVLLDRLGAQPVEAIFVGDRLQDDIGGAKNVGLKAIWIHRDRTASASDVKPDATIMTLIELLTVLDQWYPGWR